jgi:hypothetical protein
MPQPTPVYSRTATMAEGRMYHHLNLGHFPPISIVPFTPPCPSAMKMPCAHAIPVHHDNVASLHTIPVHSLVFPMICMGVGSRLSSDDLKEFLAM